MLHDVAPNLTLILDLDKSRCKKMSSRGEKVLVQFSQRGRYAKKTHERVFLKIYLWQIFHSGILSQFLLLYYQLMVILWAKPSTCSTILTKVGANCSVAWLRMKYWPMAADYEANFHSENCKLCQYFIDVAQKG